jgi:ectoine hydrolase
MPTPFEKHEYLARIERVKQAMEREGIEVLVSADPANMNYLTGYDGWSFYVPQVVVTALREPEPIWIGRGIDANGARVTTFLGEESIHGYPDDYVQRRDRHPMDFVADMLRRRGLANKRIGVEMDAYYYSAAGHAALQRGLPDATFLNGHWLVRWVRTVKSAQEIAYMKQAGRLMERVMQVGVAHIAPGVRQCDAAAAIYQAQIGGLGEFGGDYTAICPMLPTGVGTSTPHLTWSDEVFREGEATILELAAARFRYHSPLARTVFLGRPPDRVADCAKGAVEALETVLDFIRPGVACEEVVRVWKKTAAKYGVEKDSRMGYAIGCAYPPDWGEHTFSLRLGDKTVLQPDMTIHVMPGIWHDSWGVEISEAIRITDAGCECLAKVPRDLIVKP